MTKRRREIMRLMRKLERGGFPRLQMFFLVALTGAVGTHLRRTRSGKCCSNTVCPTPEGDSAP